VGSVVTLFGPVKDHVYVICQVDAKFDVQLKSSSATASFSSLSLADLIDLK
jgi:hypothetical protein